MKLGVIGYGLRIQTMIHEMKKINPLCKVAGIVDTRLNIEHAGEDGVPIPIYSTVEELVQAVKPEGLMIGTRCSLHTKFALQTLPFGIPIFLEKPVSTTMEDWLQLKQAAERYTSPVVVSHPLRLTSIVQLVKEIIDSGKIGTVEHVQASNNVPYGGVYFQSWYRDESETGGLFLQKATHDFDYINYLVGRKPLTVAAMSSKQIFKGNKPAGLKCVDCEENKICAESTAGTDREQAWPNCCFAVDTGNEDSGSALIRYEGGMHAAYSQNFFARRKAATRGARLLGYKGTVEFDFVTGLVRVFNHHIARVDSYQFDDHEGHFGGDAALAANFIDVIQKKAESLSTLQDGLTSALMCLKAKHSAERGVFLDL